MAHEIETFDDGTAAFFTARHDAWHRLGVTTRDCLTAEQVMTTARLGGWNVHTVAADRHRPDRGRGHHRWRCPTTSPPSAPTPCRASPTSSASSAPATPSCRTRSTANCSNLLVDEAGAHFETAGSLRGGRETFVTMKLPQSITLAGHQRLRRHRAVPGRHVQP